MYSVNVINVGLNLFYQLLYHRLIMTIFFKFRLHFSPNQISWIVMIVSLYVDKHFFFSIRRIIFINMQLT